MAYRAKSKELVLDAGGREGVKWKCLWFGQKVLQSVRLEVTAVVQTVQQHDTQNIVEQSRPRRKFSSKRILKNIPTRTPRCYRTRYDNNV